MIWQLVAAAVGVFVMAAPDLFGLSDGVADAFHILGPIAVSIGGMAAFEILRGVRRAHLLVGPAIALAGMLLGEGLPAMAVGLGAGAALVVLAFPGDVEGDPYSGGWRILVHGSRRDR